MFIFYLYVFFLIQCIDNSSYNLFISGCSSLFLLLLCLCRIFGMSGSTTHRIPYRSVLLLMFILARCLIKTHLLHMTQILWIFCCQNVCFCVFVLLTEVGKLLFCLKLTWVLLYSRHKAQLASANLHCSAPVSRCSPFLVEALIRSLI